MNPDEEEVLDPADLVFAFILWIIRAALIAGILFISFHLYLWLFAFMYKLSVQFHYLP